MAIASPRLLLKVAFGLLVYLIGRAVEFPDLAAFLHFEPRSLVYLATTIIIVLIVWEGSRLLYHLFDKPLYAGLESGPWIALFAGVNLVYIGVATFLVLHLFFDVVYVLLNCVPANYGRAYWGYFWLMTSSSVVMVASNGVALFFDRWKRSELRAEQYRRETLLADYQALQHQVNPHFLFNSLSVLTALVYKDQDVAADFITQLSKVYRYVLESGRKDRVRLETELEHLEAYYFLLRIRHPKGITLSVKLAPPVLFSWVPPMALQLLLENAIKHNRVLPDEPLWIRVHQQGDYLVVENNSLPRSNPEPSTGMGLDNLRQRYHYHTRLPVLVEHTPHRFTVKLPLLPHETPPAGRRTPLGRAPNEPAAAL